MGVLIDKLLFFLLVYSLFFFFFLMIRRPPRSTHCISSAASDVYKRQVYGGDGTVGLPFANEIALAVLLAACQEMNAEPDEQHQHEKPETFSGKQAHGCDMWRVLAALTPHSGTNDRGSG
eukprot:TRINITY_DN3080_c0_g1_i1.p6 TRINITY_DN3080_c0_g1~~TRINITY_DN3080_c0_g1_i1.p6  ORF type:complete len:120 (+),score=27.70 TRINITY_DN3080_c0_g1_i1:71-430(+)